MATNNVWNQGHKLVERLAEQKAEQEFTGKVAIVTGASRGIGRVIALALAQKGANVIVNYATSEDAANAVAEEINTGSNGKAAVVGADVSVAQEARKLFSEAVRIFGGVDFLINNAGVLEAGPVSQLTERQFDRTFASNVKGPFILMQEASRLLRDGGRIVNISTGGTRLTTAMPAIGVYLSSKCALENLTGSFAGELAARQITVNCVNPGTILTDMGKSLGPGVEEHMLKSTPLGRLGEPSDIADAVSFLLSDKAKFITGQAIQVSGGVVLNC